MRVPGVRFVQGRNRYGTSTKYAIAVHCTANTAPASGEASYATRRTDGTSAHFYVDGREVIQSLDTADVAGHAGSWNGNQYAIAVEITGLTSWSRQRWLNSVAWDRLGQVLAAVSKHHNIPAARVTVEQMRANPRVRGAYDHNQMRLAWGGTDHTDPGPNFPWDHLISVWRRHLTGEDDDMPSAEEIAKAVMQYPLARPDGSGKLSAGSWIRYADHRRNTIRDAVAAAEARLRAGQEAILAAVGGVDTSQILARLDAIAAEERAHREQLAADQARRDAELRELVERAERGELAADEVVREIGRKLAGEAGQE